MRFSILATCLGLALSVGACAGELPPADEALTSDAADATTVGPVASARIVQKTATARVLELVSSTGQVVATYYPGFFVVTAIVPDPDTGAASSAKVKGTWFLGATLDGKTGKVAVAVRGFVFAETSFDMVFVIDTRGAAFAANKYGAAAFTSLPFDGRGNDGSLPGTSTAVRPWLDILTAGGISWDAASRLHVKNADAAGSEAEFIYAPDLSVAQCLWTYAGANARCPQPAR